MGLVVFVYFLMKFKKFRIREIYLLENELYMERRIYIFFIFIESFVKWVRICYFLYFYCLFFFDEKNFIRSNEKRMSRRVCMYCGYLGEKIVEGIGNNICVV